MLSKYASAFKFYNGYYTQSFGYSVPFVDSKLGQNNPGWEDAISRGLDAGSPYSRRVGWVLIRNVTYRPFAYLNFKTPPHPRFGYLSLRYSGDLLSANIGAIPVSRVTASERADMKLEAKISFLNKVREIVNPFQALPFFGELKETISMIRHPLKGITYHTRKYDRRLQRIEARRGSLTNATSRDLNSAYLQWTYGVSPLLGDIENIGLAIRRLMIDESVVDIPVIVTVRRNYADDSGVFIGYDSSAPIMVAHRTDVQDSYRIKGAVRKEVLSTASDESYKFNLGISLQEFVPTAWELLPYSFLIDYFTNIGDVLGAAFTSHTALRYYWASYKFMAIRSVFGSSIPALGRTVRHSGLSEVRAKYTDFNREKPDLHVTPRDVSFRHPSVLQWVNSSSLAIAKMKSR